MQTPTTDDAMTTGADYQTGATDAPNRDGASDAMCATTSVVAVDVDGATDATDMVHVNRSPEAIAPNGATDATHAGGGTDASDNARTADCPIDHRATSRVGHDGDPPCGNRDTSLHTARRPLMGERAEPVARRMRTSGPTRRDEPPAAHTLDGDSAHAALTSVGTSAIGTSLSMAHAGLGLGLVQSLSKRRMPQSHRRVDLADLVPGRPPYS